MSQSADSFAAQGRLHYRAGESTNYDLTARTDLAAGMYGDSGAQRIVILANCAYYRVHPEECQSTEVDSMEEGLDVMIWTAVEVRWVTSPYNILELLRKSSSLKRSTDSGTVTYRGTASGARLASDGPVAPFYAMFGSRLTDVTYTLVTGRDHLPERLDIDVWSTVQPDLVYHSLYSATYRDWGGSGTITRIY